MSDTVISVENVSKLYRLGEVGTGSLAHDVNRWWHRVRGKEDPYLKIGEVNDRTKPVAGAQKRNLTTEDTERTEGTAGGNQRADSGKFLEGHSQAGLQMDSEKLTAIRYANAASGSEANSSSVLISDTRGKKTENFNLKSENSAPPASDWVYALKDVSFEVKRGEVLGIIGRNGAGKSTLLKILSRVTTQSSGQIKVKGRIASLLEVGTGFHPELTGRENIFLNGAILGMRKAEIARKFDEIVEFSGCARYIDTPVKRYSSGMYVRLAFAVAAHLEPEILIVDEVLAVGDAEFQKKCLGKMKDVAGHGRTILFVSHNMQAMQNLCERVIWMEKGSVHDAGKPAEIVDRYLFTQRKLEGLDALRKSIASLPKDPDFRLINVDLLQDGKSSTHFHSGKPIQIVMEYELFKTYGGFHVYFQLCDIDEAIVFESIHNGSAEVQVPVVEVGHYKATATIPADFLSAKTYEIKFLAGIHSYRNLLPKTLGVQIDVHAAGRVNRAYSGYSAPGQICPLIAWENISCSSASLTQPHQP